MMDTKGFTDGDSDTPIMTDSPLMRAALSNNKDLVIHLLQGGTDIDERDSQSKTPLMRCAAKGLAEMCQVLLQCGTDASLVDKHGTNALMWACLEGEQEVVDVLLQHGGLDLDAVESWAGHTAFMWAALNNSPDIVKMLISRGVCLRVRDRWGKTAKDRAAKFRHDEVVRLIEEEEKRRGEFPFYIYSGRFV